MNAEQAKLETNHWLGLGAVGLLWWYSLRGGELHIKGWAFVSLLAVTYCALDGLSLYRRGSLSEARRRFEWAWLIFFVTLVFSGWLPQGAHASGAGDGDWW